MGRSGLTIIEWKDKNGKQMIGFVFKYPFPCKLVLYLLKFEKFWPGLVSKLRLVAQKQKAIEKPKKK